MFLFRFDLEKGVFCGKVVVVGLFVKKVVLNMFIL